MIFELLQEEIEHSLFFLRKCIDIPYLEAVLIDVDNDQSCVGEFANGIRSHDRESAFALVRHNVEISIAVFVLDAVDPADDGSEIAESKLIGDDLFRFSGHCIKVFDDANLFSVAFIFPYRENLFASEKGKSLMILTLS